MDFTLKKYSELCKAIPKSYTVNDYLVEKPEKGVVLRHDVDRSPKNALKMAKIEAKHGLKASYYFRLKTFDKKMINEIKSLGHEIGYHYEVLDEAKGDFEKAKDLFEKNLALFDSVKTVCMHGNPLTKWDNKEFWKENNLEDFGLIGEAYLSFDFNKINYFTDTGRSWNNSDVSIKDITNGKLISVRNTNELIKQINSIDKGYILTHPARWNDSNYLWFKELIWQNLKNVGKRLLK